MCEKMNTIQFRKPNTSRPENGPELPKYVAVHNNGQKNK